MNDDVFQTPPQPDQQADMCPDDILGALKSLHRMTRRLDRAVIGDPYAIPAPVPGLQGRMATVETKLDDHIAECQTLLRHARKRWSLPKKLAIAALIAGAGALATWGVNAAVSHMTSSTGRAAP